MRVGAPRQNRTRTGEEQRIYISHRTRRAGMHSNWSSAARAPPYLLGQANRERVEGNTCYSNFTARRRQLAAVRIKEESP